MWVFDLLNSESYQLGLGDELPAAAGKGSMDGTQFVAAKSHGTPFDGLNESVVAGGNQGRRTIERSPGYWAATIPARGKSIVELD